MINSKSEQKKTQLVLEEKVNIRKTLLGMSVGEKLELSCLDISLVHCRVVASQIKKNTNHVYNIRSNEFGTSFCVTRLS